MREPTDDFTPIELELLSWARAINTVGMKNRLIDWISRRDFDDLLARALMERAEMMIARTRALSKAE